MLRRITIFVAVLFIGVSAFSQTIGEAGEKYNEGNEKYSAKAYAEAVTAFEEALSNCIAVGPEADDLKGNVQKQLNNAYYKNGLSLYKKKQFDEAISFMTKSLVLSEELGDDSKKAKNINYIAKIHSTKGTSLVKAKDLDGAMAEFDKAHEIKPTCVNAFYGKGLVYKTKGDMTLMMENVDLAIENGAGNAKADKTVAKSKKLASKALFKAGATEITKEHGKQAAEYLNASLKYAPGTFNTYYYLTIANNKAKAFSAAIEASNKALELAEGDKSDVYFEIGQAQEGLGDSAAACEAYKKVSGGNNIETAKYKITTELKCG